MKTKLITTTMIMLFALMLAVPVMATTPTSVTLLYKRTYFRWYAAAAGSPFGGWSGTIPWFQNLLDSRSFTLAGNRLSTTFLYALPEQPTGASTVYIYNKASDLWIQHEGTMNYTTVSLGLPITEYWRGYLKFSGTPSAESFVHSVAYRWGYVYGVDETTVKAAYPYAVWDTTMGAWLLEFDIYLWDPITYTQSYTTPFPSPFIEPVPANNYNPLGL